MYSRTAILLGAVLLAGVPASAQDYKPVEVTIGGGVTFPSAEVRDHLGDGYNINFGVTVNVSPIIGIEGLYSFNGLGQKQITIPVSPTPGRDRRADRLLRRHEHAVRDGEPGGQEADR